MYVFCVHFYHPIGILRWLNAMRLGMWSTYCTSYSPPPALPPCFHVFKSMYPLPISPVWQDDARAMREAGLAVQSSFVEANPGVKVIEHVEQLLFGCSCFND